MITKALKSKSFLILWILIIAYIIIFSLLFVWKYNYFGYNALDLAIYNQVFFNSIHGHLFQFTIHPHSYLGDHFEIFILFLLPFYYIFSSPITLLILQIIFLGLAAWPLYLIAREKLDKGYGLFFGFIFLISAAVNNINAFEFHILPFIIFFLFWIFYFYQKKKFPLFIIFTLIALTIREDVSLIIIMFSVLAFIEKRSWRWKIAPALLGLTWFIVSLNLISSFNQYGQYKFFYYYHWLGSSVPEALNNILAKPYLIFVHLFSLENIIFVIAIFLLFAGLPLLKPKLLILSFFTFLQILLASFSGLLIIETHYSAGLIVPLFLASLDGFRVILAKKWQWAILALAIITIYAVVTIGPLPGFIKMIIKNEPAKEIVSLKNNFINQVPATASVVSTYDFLTKLSGRSEVYSLHYVFKGTKQYSSEEYKLPDNVNYALIDFNDFLVYQSQYSSQKEVYATGDDRVRNILQTRNFGLVKITDNYTLWQKDYPSSLKLYEILNNIDEIENNLALNLNNQIKVLGYSSPQIKKEEDLSTFNFSLYWQSLQPMEKNYQLQLEYLDQEGKSIYQKIYPLAYGLYPTSQWQNNEIVKTNQLFYLPKKLTGQINSVRFSLIDLKDYLDLNQIKSAEIKITSQKTIGEPFVIKI